MSETNKQKIIGLTLVVFFLLGSLQSYSQSRKTIVKEKVRSRTIKEYDYTTGRERSYIVKVEKFDERGNEVELMEYEERKLVKHTKSLYDEENNEILRTYFYPNGKVMKTYRYIYEGKLRKEKLIYDEDGNLLIKREYIYEQENEAINEDE